MRLKRVPHDKLPPKDQKLRDLKKKWGAGGKRIKERMQDTRERNDPYAYHGSPASNHESIKKHGLSAPERDGVGAMEGKKVKFDNFFAASEREAEGYGGAHGEAERHLYRVKKSHLRSLGAGKNPFNGYVSRVRE